MHIPKVNYLNLGLLEGVVIVEMIFYNELFFKYDNFWWWTILSRKWWCMISMIVYNDFLFGEWLLIISHKYNIRTRFVNIWLQFALTTISFSLCKLTLF
jgi:hypothetical protein